MMGTQLSRAAGAMAGLVLLAGGGEAFADSTNFELAGKIYTKWLYQNDDTTGCLSLSNPFWRDNIGGHNGVCSEFELGIKGRVSRHVSAGVRLQSRWGALWQDWWENGDIRWDYPTDTPFTENTSGESLGQNHAQYIKLRSVWARIAAPIPTVKWIHVGATDFGMFNEWTIGKSRYIDRDNGNGVFVEGELLDGGLLSYHTGAIALPKLYVGPRWNTGLKDADPLAGFWGSDWAYALKLQSNPLDGLRVALVTSYIHDWEADRWDPDKTGQADRDRGADHAIDLQPRFRGLNATLEGQYSPADLDLLAVTGLIAFSQNDVNHEYATNAVQGDQGFSPILYRLDDDGNPVPARGLAGKILVELFDPLELGLSLKAEYFNIGTDYNALFGARREADVLLTDGIIGGGFVGGGQLPTLNIANEFVDFDEPWYETVIGWHGATGLLEWVQGSLRADLEYTYVGYNTNAQDRDVDLQYPDFLYTDGFTDVNAFTVDSDYANVYDRGKDPRSVYKEYQDRRTHIVVLKGDMLVPFVDDLTFKTKLKYVNDRDDRKLDNPADDYEGDAYMYFAGVGYQVNNELKTTLGYEYQQWIEDQRSGSQERGFFDYRTHKHIGRAGASYVFGGATFNWILEYFHKDLARNVPEVFNQTWNVWRSKASFEVSW